MLKNTKKVKKNLEKYKKNVLKTLSDKFNYLMTECENEAKQNAPWTDRTGNARNSIYGRVLSGGKTGVLGIGVSYGIQLELGYQGKYRIIWPVIEQKKRDLLRILK